MSLTLLEPEPPFARDLSRAQAAIDAAEQTDDSAGRYLAAHLAALRVAAAVLAVRAHRRVGGGPRDVWSVLAHAAPEYGEWAGYFATVHRKTRTVSAGASGLVSVREADDLVRDAQAFHDEVERRFRAWLRHARERGPAGVVAAS